MTAKKPQDHKAKGEDAERGPFKFTAPDGTEHELPEFRTGTLRKIRKITKDPMDVMFTVIEDLASEETLAAIDAMRIEESNKLVGDWMEHLGMDLGKSSGSSA